MDKPDREFYQVAFDKLDDLDAVERLRLMSRPRRLWRALPNMIWQGGFYAIVAWVAWMAADRNYPVEFLTARPRAIVVAAGGEITIDYTVQRKRICESRTFWTFTDAIGRRFDFSGVPRNAAGSIGPDAYPFAFHVPSEMSAGPARLRAFVSWECPGNLVHPLYPLTLQFTDLVFSLRLP